jgi:hypothetical protein
MAIAFILLLLACFGSATVQVLWERRRGVTPIVKADTTHPPVEPPLGPPPPRPRRTLQLGAVTCEVVSFEDFDVIKTSEHVMR